jgi:hypothetical protein
MLSWNLRRAEMLQLRPAEEEATRGTYELTCGDLEVRISVAQSPSMTDQSGAVILQWNSPDPQQAVVRYGTDLSLPMSVSESTFSRQHRLEVNELQGRGTRYHFEISWKDRDGVEKRVGPFRVRTLFRYPYDYRISPQNRELRHK